MKKILILLSLIYLVSCKLFCNTEENPKNYEDCFNRVLEDEENNCCYLKVFAPSLGNVSVCYEFRKSLDIEYLRKELTRQYYEDNSTLEELACPSNRKDNDSSHEDQQPSINLCNNFETKDTKSCFSKDVIDENNNYCCFLKVSLGNLTKSGCGELPKNETVSDLKQKLNKLYGIVIENIQCPSNEKEENTPQENPSNIGHFISSLSSLIIVLLI